MASLLEHVMINKLSDELNEAITAVGGDTSCASGPMDYPDIIRDQLSANGFTGSNNLVEGDGIAIEKVDGGYKISSNSNSILVNDLQIFHNIDNDSNADTIPAGTTIQNVFVKLFEDILPTLPSVIKGDIIKATPDGTDQYQNPNFTNLAIKSGLVPGELYIRIFLVSQQEPIYISCAPLGDVSGVQLSYKGVDTETIKMNVDNETGEISADLIGVGKGVINEYNMDPQFLLTLQPTALDNESASNMFDDIFGV